MVQQKEPSLIPLCGPWRKCQQASFRDYPRWLATFFEFEKARQLPGSSRKILVGVDMATGENFHQRFSARKDPFYQVGQESAHFWRVGQSEFGCRGFWSYSDGHIGWLEGTQSQLISGVVAGKTND